MAPLVRTGSGLTGQIFGVGFKGQISVTAVLTDWHVWKQVYFVGIRLTILHTFFTIALELRMGNMET